MNTSSSHRLSSTYLNNSSYHLNISPLQWQIWRQGGGLWGTEPPPASWPPAPAHLRLSSKHLATHPPPPQHLVAKSWICPCTEPTSCVCHHAALDYGTLLLWSRPSDCYLTPPSLLAFEVCPLVCTFPFHQNRCTSSFWMATFCSMVAHGDFS